MNVLFVCHGNICRSPIAEAMLKKKYADFKINSKVSSAGFESYNINEPPHPYAVEYAKKFNLSLDHKARIFLKRDFDEFDKIYVMDTRNFIDVKDLARNKQEESKIDYLMNVIHPGRNETIPDPFTSGVTDTAKVFNLLNLATDKIVELALKN